MKWFGRILLTTAFLAVLAITTVQVGCKDTSPKNVDNDPKEEELEMPDISGGDDEDDDDDDDSEASLNGPDN